MPTQRTADILLEAFKDEMVSRRKFEVKDSNDKVLMTLYFKPITRYARVRAQQLAGSDDALIISTQLLCQKKEQQMSYLEPLKMKWFQEENLKLKIQMKKS